MDNDYAAARAVFALFKERIQADADLAAEFQTAVITLRSSYSTSIRENRFIVGGAIEHFLVAAFNGARIPAVHVGVGDTRIDVRVQGAGGDAGFSTKASFSSHTVRLINTLGATVPVWNEPTLFLFSENGIVYADPELLPNATRQDRDALVLEGRQMKAYIAAHPEYVIPMNFRPPQRGTIANSRTASEDVARTIIRNFPRLLLP